MFCDRCGAQLVPGQNFCSQCGKPFQPVPLMPARGRIAGHIRLLGILWIALSAFRLIPAGALLFMSQPEVHIFPPDAPEFLPIMFRYLGYAFLISAGAGLAAGWGLLQRQPWGRMLAIAMGCISLFDMPFGTALGIYTLWVLLPATSEEEYRQIANVA